MKHAKKLFSLLLVLAMVLGMSVSAAAAKITIDDGDITGASYGAYRLLDASNAPGEDDTGSDKYVYSVNDIYRDALMSALGLADTAEHTVTDGEIIGAIADLEDDGDVQAFANAVYGQIKAMDPDKPSVNNVFELENQGYYLIAETKVGSAGENQPSDTFSLVMLDTVGLDEIEVTTKEKTPTVTKEVQDVNDTEGTSGWGDSADHDIGDIVNFRLTGTVSDKYEYYNEYGYKFEDTMQQGLTMQAGSVNITINGKNVTEQFKIVPSEHGFEAYTNLKDLTGVTVTAGTQVIVTYQAELNEDALLGASGNKNSVILYYENDPYAEDYVTPANPGDPDVPKDPENPEDPENPPELPGKTPPAVTVIFTFKGSVNKVDKDGKALKGAGFTLYKWYKNGDSGEWKPVGSEIKPDDGNVFNWEGLDAGKYKLVESTVPAGYNKAEDLVFKVEAEYNDLSPDSLKRLVIRGEDGNSISEGNTPVFTISSDYVFTTNVKNLTGAELPETGGMGTTLIYVVGGILSTAALVLLITKKRMSSEK